VYYKDLYPLINFLPRYANTLEAPADADMLPLWRVSDDLTRHHRTDGSAGNVRSAADKLDHRHPGHSSSLPASFVIHGSDAPQDDSKSQASWLYSLRKSSSPNPPPRCNTFDLEKCLASVECDRPLEPAQIIPNPSMCDYIPILRIFRWLFRVISRHENPKGDDIAWRKMKKMDIVESNVPLEIILVLSG
jgi:putative membrane protein